MRSPSGWVEPGQTPQFDEYTYVLKGSLQVNHKGGVIEVRAGQAVITRKGEWVQYSTPSPDGAHYIAVCLPAFFAEHSSSGRIDLARRLSAQIVELSWN